MSNLEFAKIKWDEKGELGDCPLGAYHVGIVQISNSKGMLSTNLLGIISPTKDLIGAGLPNLPTAIQVAEGHYQRVLQALISESAIQDAAKMAEEEPEKEEKPESKVAAKKSATLKKVK